MKRHLHRKTKICVGDRVRATTEIVTRGGGYVVPLGSSGKVKATPGQMLAVSFDSFPEGKWPTELGHAGTWVTRGQVRLVVTAEQMAFAETKASEHQIPCTPSSSES